MATKIMKCQSILNTPKDAQVFYGGITKLIERQQRRSTLIERYNIFMNRKIQCFKDVITPNIDLDL